MTEVLKDVEKLKLEVKYRLIDKEGWFDNHSINRELLSKLPFIEESFTLKEVLTSGGGMVPCKVGVEQVIGPYEYKYFKEVHEVDDTEDTKENKTSYEIGDYVCISKPDHTTDYNKDLYKIVFISEDKSEYVVEDDNKALKVVNKVYSRYLSTKELKLKDMIDYYKTQSLDFANSDKDTMITLEMAAKYAVEVY